MLPNTKVIQTNNTKYMLFDSPDFITHIVSVTGQFELDLVTATEKILNGRGGVVLDIGANMGTYTVPLAQRNPHLDIVSFEPQKAIYYQLCGNVALNSIENVEAYNVAVGEQAETIELAMPDYTKEENIGGFSLDPFVKSKTPTSIGRVRPVDVITIDSMNFESVCMIKIDVEGLEINVLRGAKETIERSGFPPIIFESWTQYDWWEEKQKELFDYVEGLGYTMTSPYVNNFLAVHKDYK
jgi:FkbM family methyltransferase